MQTITYMLLPSVIYLVGIFSFIYPLVWLQKRRQKGRKSPISGQLLRSPGTSLQQQIDDMSLDIMSYIAIFPTLPLLLYAILLPSIQVQLISVSVVAILIALVIGVLLWIGIRVHRLMTKRNQYRLGLDAELAVGQELNQLMLDGCRVFHDFPAENFNIDHVVISPSGVYAVETKGRAKPDKGRGKIDANVIFDGEKLQFPDWFETKPLDQARRQADWLSKWLTSAVGSPVKAQGVLVFPGWYVERKGAGQVIVISGKEAYHLKKSSSNNYVPEMIQRIAHQVEQRCRDVEPVAYRKEKS